MCWCSKCLHWIRNHCWTCRYSWPINKNRAIHLFWRLLTLRLIMFVYNVVLTNCRIGDFCIIHNGVFLGQDGFGFFVDEQGHMMKKPQNLEVMMGNHAEIGTNTCIDRGRSGMIL